MEHVERRRADGGRSDGEGEYVCEACGKTFATEEELDRHVREQGLVD